LISLFGNGIVYVSLILTVLFYVKLLKKLIPSEVLSLRIIYLINLLPFILLIYAFSISDFTLLNVIENSYIDDPLFYKVTSAWGSHEGSILLWVFLINLFGIFFLNKNHTVEIHKNIIFISTLFLLYVVHIRYPIRTPDPAVPFQALRSHLTLQPQHFQEHHLF